MSDFVMSVRKVVNEEFVAEVGPTSFLIVPDSAKTPSPVDSQLKSADEWYELVLKAAIWKNPDGETRGDILFIVHGYNNSEIDVLERHRRIQNGLVSFGFKGVVVSFDWPSDNNALAYLPDRHRAKLTAMQLVTDGITHLSIKQSAACQTNVHVLGHSTGAYVIREAFDDADDSRLSNSSWNVSQILFAAGDISSESMSAHGTSSQSVYRHCVRLTNYFNKYDAVLDISNVKRLGIAPRVGRIGLPDDVPQKAVNLNCSDYYDQFDSSQEIQKQDQPLGISGVKSHSWYFGNRVFTQDLFYTIIGKDRSVMPTRKTDQNGNLMLSRTPV